QGIDNEETSSAYDTGYVSESLPTPEISGNEQVMYQSDEEDSESDELSSDEHESSDSDESQNGGVIQDEQMYVDGESSFSPLHIGSPSSQGEETPELQSTQTNNESSTGFSVM
ncbi:10590_t:CDS:1, partial [Racocetra fulgida]